MEIWGRMESAGTSVSGKYVWEVGCGIMDSGWGMTVEMPITMATPPSCTNPNRSGNKNRTINQLRAIEPNLP